MKKTMVTFDGGFDAWTAYLSRPKQDNHDIVVTAMSGAGKSFVLAPLVQARVLKAEAQIAAPNEHVNEED